VVGLVLEQLLVALARPLPTNRSTTEQAGAHHG
jgi:hypothetical protein